MRVADGEHARRIAPTEVVIRFAEGLANVPLRQDPKRRASISTAASVRSGPSIQEAVRKSALATPSSAGRSLTLMAMLGSKTSTTTSASSSATVSGNLGSLATEIAHAHVLARILLVTAGRFEPSVMSDVKVIVSPFDALVDGVGEVYWEC